ncbi:hypothetical protein B5M09_010449 [Aphanomyces astaci]|uniref:Uncharacterized protein n=1 Tax=Aphanomyces astaci TaxID=112090 RepID=A0A425D728_APHAT|nr:hypothetical protein B5M09_010449 [Aphanomyces astaci]
MTSNTGETDANSTDAALTTVDNTLARRRYFREKQRNYRRKVNVDVAIVEAELAHLQSIRDILQASMPPSIAPREASDGLLSWIEVRQVSPTHILMREVSHFSNAFRAHDGFLSMAELAVLEGIDVTGIDDDDKDAYVRREFVRRGNDALVSWRQWFTGLLQAWLQ